MRTISTSYTITAIHPTVNVDLAKKAYALQSDVSNHIFSIPAI